MRVHVPLPPAVEERLRYWHRLGRSDKAVAAKLAAEFPGTAWSRRRVQYWRERLNLDGNSRVALESRTLAAQADVQRRAYAAKKGWGHLLPYEDEDTGEMVKGCELKPKEVDLLTALADHGAQTTPQLCLRVGLVYKKGCLRSGGDIYLRRLIDAGLVVRGPHRAGKPVYELAPGVSRHARSMNPTSIEQALRKAGLSLDARSQDARK